MQFATSHADGMTLVTVFAEDGTLADELGVYRASGLAVVNPSDVFDPTTGTVIALGRAIKSLGQQLEDIGLAQTITRDEYQRVRDFIARSQDQLLILGVRPGDIGAFAIEDDGSAVDVSILPR